MTELNLPFAFYVVAASILGLLIGSFLNVVIHRVPLGESIVFPGSHCPACDAGVRAYDNIPLLSYALLKGRCRNCSERISWRYPLVELLTASVFALIVFKTGANWEALLEMVFASVMLSLVFIDAIHHLLPNVITYPAMAFAMAAATARAGWGEPHVGGMEVSVILPTLVPIFTPWKAAIFGGGLLALAVPSFRLIDRLDLILYNKYFDWTDSDEEGEAGIEKNVNAVAEPEPLEPIDEAAEAAAEIRYQRTIRTSVLLGLLIAVIWAGLCVTVSAKHPQAFSQAYRGLWGAFAGAVVGSMPIWWLRAIYFLVRGIEGMGLGDVKLMAIVGAFLGWQGAFGVLLFGSIVGSIIGAFLAWRSKSGVRTAMPFGVCLGAVAVIVMMA